MKKLMGSFGAKTAAVLLCVVTALAFALSCVGIAYNFIEDSYEDGPSDFLDSRLCDWIVQRESDRVAAAQNRALYLTLVEKNPEAAAAEMDSLVLADGYCYTITDDKGQVLADTASGAVTREGWQSRHGNQFYLPPEAADGSSEPGPAVTPIPDATADSAATPIPEATAESAVTPMPEATAAPAGVVSDVEITPVPDGVLEAGRLVTTEFTVQGALRLPLPETGIFHTASRWHGFFIAARSWVFVIAVLSLALGILLLVFLMCGAGHRSGDEEIHRSWIDKIPTDLFLAGLIFLGVCAAYGISMLGSVYYLPLMLLAAVCAIVGATLLALLLLMSCAVRVKTHTFLRNTVIFRVIKFCWRVLCAICRPIARVFQNLPALWKLLLCLFAYLLFSVIVVLSGGWFGTLLWVGVTLTGIVFLSQFVLQLKRLQEGAARLCGGDLSFQIPLTDLYAGCRTHAEYLNSIAAGMGRAVDARMKSERMKTDLITNVSHDLKTPLTSIVNYVDLLKKEDLHNETAAEYVEVLDRQSQRLKKLTEDIVEASKAQSGALNVNLAPTDLAELLRQCAAEYADRFAAAELTPVLSLPDGPIPAMADGRLLFRVLDNLLGNAVKYAQPGTRVYLDAARTDKDALLTVRNVSREPLNIDADELRERFARGDASRSTEGSGLGLSIADDLMKLQNGVLTLAIDGDLFRAAVTLPLAEAAE